MAYSILPSRISEETPTLCESTFMYFDPPSKLRLTNLDLVQIMGPIQFYASSVSHHMTSRYVLDRLEGFICTLYTEPTDSINYQFISSFLVTDDMVNGIQVSDYSRVIGSRFYTCMAVFCPFTKLFELSLCSCLSGTDGYFCTLC